jgi:PEGA domain-containing protein
MDTDMLRDESTAPADIPGLVAQARTAYQQNRIKECLALTKAALLVDPGNSAALEMQSAVRFDMQRDLSDARALIEESRNKPEAQKYRKAAEIILLKALYLDPDSEGAKTLLSTIRLASEGSTSPMTSAPEAPVSFAPPVVSAPPTPAKPTPPPAPAPPVVFAAPVVREPEPVVYRQPYREPVVESPVVFAPPVDHDPPVSYEPPAVFAESESASHQETTSYAASTSRPDTIVSSNVMQPDVTSSSSEPIPFTVGTSYIEKPGYLKNGKKRDGRSNFLVPAIVVAILVIAAGLLLFRQKLGTDASASTGTESTPRIPDQPASSQHSSSPASSVSAPALNTSSNPGTTAAPTQPRTTLVAANTPPALPDNPSANTNSAANSNSNSKTNTASTPATGSLAVSCAIAAEIYIGGKQVGSTPTTLQLPAGNQTIEYRHGDLKAVVTHVIKAKETTTALVVFETTVQVTARPWATVSIEGSPRLPLGETPLSDVRLPVGSVLVFENPNFPSKSRKIAPDDKAIQMVFP